jgi:DNA-binding XRE family transcriptional regulator
MPDLKLQKKIKELSTPEPNSGCWLWEHNCFGTGYGMLKWNGRTSGAHRFSYEAFVGDIPSGLCALHLCDTPLCVNPNHIWIGTKADNAIDAARKGRFRKSNPSSWGEKQHCSKLTKADVADILVMRSLRGLTLTKIAERFGVNHKTIYPICAGKSWQHLTHGHRDVIVFPEGEPLESFNSRLDEMFDYLRSDQRPHRPRLAESDIAEICEMRYLRGLTPKQISKEFGVSRSTINKILAGTLWKHITGRST